MRQASEQQQAQMKQKQQQEQQQQQVRQLYESKKWKVKMENIAREEEKRHKEEHARRLHKSKQPEVQVQPNQITTVADVHVDASQVQNAQNSKAKVQAVYARKKESERLPQFQNEDIQQVQAGKAVEDQEQKSGPTKKWQEGLARGLVGGSQAGKSFTDRFEDAFINNQKLMEEVCSFGPGKASGDSGGSGQSMSATKKVGDMASAPDPLTNMKAKQPKNAQEKRKAYGGPSSSTYTEPHVSTSQSVQMVRGILSGEDQAR